MDTTKHPTCEPLTHNDEASQRVCNLPIKTYSSKATCGTITKESNQGLDCYWLETNIVNDHSINLQLLFLYAQTS